MFSYKVFLDSLHKYLSRSRVIVKIAIVVRNQCRRIIAYHLAESPNSDKNGEQWLISLFAPHSLTFVDVGANRGDWTKMFLESSQKPLTKGLLFEPGEAALEYLHKRFEDVASIEIVGDAVADFVGQTTFFEQANIGECSSLISQWAKKSKAIECKVTTLDHEISNRDWDEIDFLKIDCEGYDFKVMQGAAHLIKDQKIGVIQFEYNSPWAIVGSTLISAINFLLSCDYEVYLLSNSGLCTFKYELYGDFFEYSNFVAISPRFKPIVMHHVVDFV